MKKYNFEETNYFVFRLIMGMNLMIHGAVRIFGDYSDFTDRMEKMFSATIIPKFLVVLAANIISPIELIFGFLLLIGFKTKFSIIVLNSLMLLLISGVCLVQKWELASIQMGYVLYLFFLGVYIKHNRLSIDHL